mmetsp:Transcript_4415/g.10477  ORF Transcript_4415/g.10477 Transcript_4415/m.10477 type:complete len:265 (-) Transcript_4415:185-979(-)
MCLGASVPAAFAATNSKRGSFRESHYQMERRSSGRNSGKQQAAQAVQHTDVDESVLGKTKLCKFYTRGHCSLGRTCNFAHGRKELRATPNLFRTEMCFEYMSTGWCFHGANCKYAHSEAELRSVGPAPAPAAEEPEVELEVSPSSSKADSDEAPKAKSTRMDLTLPQSAKPRGKFLWADVQQYEAEEQWSEPSDEKECSPTASVTTAKSLDFSKFTSESSGSTSEADDDQEVVVTWVVKRGCLDLVPLQSGARTRASSTPPGSA